MYAIEPVYYELYYTLSSLPCIDKKYIMKQERKLLG